MTIAEWMQKPGRNVNCRMEKRISSGSPWEDRVGYSRAVRKGPHVWVSGTTAIQDGEVVGKGDGYKQAMRCFEIISAALEEAGAGMKDVVSTRMYVTDISVWEEIGRAHSAYFKDVRPAATMVEVKGLIDPDMLVEIEVEAFVMDHYLLSSQG